MYNLVNYMESFEDYCLFFLYILYILVVRQAAVLVRVRIPHTHVHLYILLLLIRHLYILFFNFIFFLIFLRFLVYYCYRIFFLFLRGGSVTRYVRTVSVLTIQVILHRSNGPMTFHATLPSTSTYRWHLL